MNKFLLGTTIYLLLCLTTYTQHAKAQKTTAKGLSYNIITKSKDKTKPKQDDLIFFTVEVRSFKDSVLQKRQVVDAYKLQKYIYSEGKGGKKDSTEDKFFEVFTALSKGDSAIVKEPTNNIIKDQNAFFDKKIAELQEQISNMISDKTLPDSSKSQYLSNMQMQLNQIKDARDKPNPLLQKDKHVLYLFSLKDFMSEQMYLKNKDEITKKAEMQRQNDRKERTAKEEVAIKEYLTKNKLIKKAKKTQSGLYYIMLEEGKGELVTIGKNVSVDYKGELLTGKVFDTSIEAEAKKANLQQAGRTYEPIQFGLGQGMVIKGWDEGIALLKKGGKAILLIPSPLAYGERGAGGDIPANSILRFDVTLVDFK